MSEPAPTVPVAFRKTVQFLRQQKVPFVVVGGLAAGLQGEPRVTRDVDLMVLIKTSQVPHLARAAKLEGFDIDADLAETQWLASGFVRLWLGPLNAQVAVDLMACNSDFLRQAMWRAKESRFAGIRVPVASPEDLVLFKLSAWRQKDIPDAEAVYLRHKEHLDLVYLRKWAAWFAAKNPCFREMPERLEALLTDRTLPPAVRGS